MSCVRPLCFFAHSAEEYRDPQVTAAWWQQQRLAQGFPPQVAAPPQLPLGQGMPGAGAMMPPMGMLSAGGFPGMFGGDPHQIQQMQMQILMQQAAAAMFQGVGAAGLGGAPGPPHSYGAPAGVPAGPLMLAHGMAGMGQQGQQQHLSSQQEVACTYDSGLGVGGGSGHGGWGGAPAKRGGGPRGGAPQQQRRHAGADIAADLAASLQELDLGGGDSRPRRQQQQQQKQQQQHQQQQQWPKGGGAPRGPRSPPAAPGGEEKGAGGSEAAADSKQAADASE
jgi:hypothetical protein